MRARFIIPLLAVVAVASVVRAQGKAGGAVPLPASAASALTPPSPVDTAEATRRLAPPVYDLTCRAGSTAWFKLGVLEEGPRSRTRDSLYWALQLNVRVASSAAGAVLGPGECRVPRALASVAPVLRLWRYLETAGSGLSPADGLQTLSSAPERGIIEVNAPDAVFQNFAFRVSDSRIMSGTYRLPQAGGRTVEIPPGSPFRLRVTAMPCDRNCAGFKPSTWEYYVVEAPLP